MRSPRQGRAITTEPILGTVQGTQDKGEVVDSLQDQGLDITAELGPGGPWGTLQNHGSAL